MKEVKKINFKYLVDIEMFDFYGLLIYEKCMMMVFELLSVIYLSEFLVVKDLLIESVIKMMYIIFEKCKEKKKVFLDDEKKKELIEKIDKINYLIFFERDFGLFVDYMVYEEWKKGQSSYEV